eukprot:521689-Pleurochrysis_carterae.AAC.2
MAGQSTSLENIGRKLAKIGHTPMDGLNHPLWGMAPTELFSIWAVRACPFYTVPRHAPGRIARIAASHRIAMADPAAVAAPATDPAPANPPDAEAAAAAHIEHHLLF